MRNVPLAPDIDAKILARGTPGFSGADLANLVNEAALLAARRNKRIVTQHEFEDAKDKVMMGAERRSLVMSEEERRNTAYHEAGHAIVGLSVPYDPLHKVTIIPRGRALGVTMNLPEGDRLRAAPQMVRIPACRPVRRTRSRDSSLAARRTSPTAPSATSRWRRNWRAPWSWNGACPTSSGAVRYNGNEQEVFLGHSVTQTKNISDETAKLIDEEMRNLISDGEATAKRILTEKPGDLHQLASGPARARNAVGR